MYFYVVLSVNKISKILDLLNECLAEREREGLTESLVNKPVCFDRISNDRLLLYL